MADCGPNCEETLKKIELVLDGEAEQAVRAAVEQHLSDCAPCLERAEFRKHVKDLIHSKCSEHEVPLGLESKIQELIRTYESPAGT